MPSSQFNEMGLWSNRSGDSHVTYLPLVNSEGRQLPVHFISEEEVHVYTCIYMCIHNYVHMTCVKDMYMYTILTIKTVHTHTHTHTRAHTQIGCEERLLKQYCECHSTRTGTVTALQDAGCPHSLVTQLVDEWLDRYRRMDKRREAAACSSYDSDS